MGGKGTLSCLLCAGLLPEKEEEVLEQHMKDHHRVFTNITLVVAATKLEADQLAVVTKMVVDMGVAKVVVSIWEDEQKKSTKEETKKDFPNLEPEIILKEDSEVGIKADEDDVKYEAESDCDDNCGDILQFSSASKNRFENPLRARIAGHASNIPLT